MNVDEAFEKFIKYQEVMGHEDVNTTMIYVHPQMEQVKAVITLHSPLNEYYSGK